jgi:hypothetical protein
MNTTGMTLLRTYRLKRAHIVAIGLLALVALGACSKSGPTGPSPTPAPTATFQSLSIQGSQSVEQGSQTQLTVTAHYSDGRTRDVTNQASYQSSDDRIAVASSTGLVTAVRPGNVDITASYEEAGIRREDRRSLTVAREVPEFSLSVSVQRIRINGDCDQGPIIQAGPGEFTYRIQTRFPSDVGAVTLSDSARRVSRSNGESITVGRTRQDTFEGNSGSITVDYFLTEWDDNTADSRMNNRRGSRTHRLSGDQWTGTGSNSVTVVGSGSCSARLDYTFSAGRVN